MIEEVKRLINTYPTLLNKYGINTKLRQAHFFGQLAHESNLKPISENLNYSSDRLLVIFKKYFTQTEAINFHRQPEKIANRVYANRMGNGDEKSGDGWKYRGKGFIQLTGKDNYIKLTKTTGIDFVNNPDILLEEVNALIAACEYWKWINANSFADIDDVKSITKLINGGYNGLEDRVEKVKSVEKGL